MEQRRRDGHMTARRSARSSPAKPASRPTAHTNGVSKSPKKAKAPERIILGGMRARPMPHIAPRGPTCPSMLRRLGRRLLPQAPANCFWRLGRLLGRQTQGGQCPSAQARPPCLLTRKSPHHGAQAKVPKRIISGDWAGHFSHKPVRIVSGESVCGGDRT